MGREQRRPLSRKLSLWSDCCGLSMEMFALNNNVMSLRVWYNLHSDSVQEKQPKVRDRQANHAWRCGHLTDTGWGVRQEYGCPFPHREEPLARTMEKQILVSKSCENQMFQPVNCLNPTCISPGVLVSDMEEKSDCPAPGVQCLYFPPVDVYCLGFPCTPCSLRLGLILLHVL